MLTNKDTSSHSVALALAQGQVGTRALFGFDASHTLHWTAITCNARTALTVSAQPRVGSLRMLPDAGGLFRTGFER